MRWLPVVLLGCQPPPTEPAPTVTVAPRSCSEPDLRYTTLPGPAAETHRYWGAGIAAFDLDGDGDLDLLAAGPHEVTVYRNDGAAGFDVADVVEPYPWFRAVGASVADVDEDGDGDVLVTQWGAPDVLLRNDDGLLVVAQTLGSGHSQSSAWLDLDEDGHLDLVVAGHGPVVGGEQVVVPGPGDPLAFWRSTGDGALEAMALDVDPRADDGYTYVAGFTNLDGDGRPDLLLANDYPIYRPTLAARRTAQGFVADQAAQGLELRAAGMGLGAADVNGDGWDDFLLPVWDRIVVLRSAVVDDGSPRWVDASAAMGLALPEHEDAWIGWGGEWADLDNDGDLDALVAFGHLDAVAPLTPSGGPSANAAEQRLVAYENTGNGFVERSTDWGFDHTGVFRGFVATDLDGDGWIDIAVRDLLGPVHILRSACGSNRSLTVRPLPGHRAVGAEVSVWREGVRSYRTVRAGGTSLASGGPPEAHFGMGQHDSVDRIEIRWPDGAFTSLGPVPANALVTVTDE